MNTRMILETCLSLLVLFISESTYAKVPSSWIKKPNTKNAASFVAATSSDNETDNNTSNTLGPDLSKLINSTYAVVSPSVEQKDEFGLTSLTQNKKQGPWYLASIKTELGIEAGGEIGLVGAEGEAAVEYIWMRTARSMQKLQKEHYEVSKKNKQNTKPSQSESNTLYLSTDMPGSEVNKKIEDLVSHISQTKKVSGTAKMRSQLTQQVNLHQSLAQKVADNSPHLTWKPYKYQLELYIEASGAVHPAIDVGAVVRVRIEWSIIEKKSLIETSPADFANHIEMVTEELSANLHSSMGSSSQFDLYGIKMGLGLGVGGDLDLVSANAHAIASVFLKYNPPRPYKPNQLHFASNEVVKEISVDRWRRGIRKASKMASYIIAQSSSDEKKMDETRPKRDFELGAIEVELELTAEGEFFLPTVKGIAFMELFFNKKNLLKP